MPRDVQRFRKIYPYVRVQPVNETTAGAAVDTSGLDWKESCRVATTSNISLSPSPSSIDSVTLSPDDRVLVKNQTTASQNGIYYFDGTDLTRTTDGSGANLTSGAAVYIEEGSNSAGCSFILITTNPITVGSTNLTWIKFAGAGSAIFTSTTTPTNKANTNYSVAFDSSGSYASTVGSDVYFYVSGSNEYRAVFGGTVLISGTTHMQNDLYLGGRLLNSGGSNLVTAGTGITINQDADGINIGLTPSIGGNSTPSQYLRFLAGSTSTTNDNASKYSIGMDYFDYTNAPFSFSTATYYFNAIVKVSTGTTGSIDLYDYNGNVAGVPGAITGSTLTTSSSTTYELVTAQVDWLTGASSSTLFEARLWCNPSGSNLDVSCKGCWLEIRPATL